MAQMQRNNEQGAHHIFWWNFFLMESAACRKTIKGPFTFGNTKLSLGGGPVGIRSRYSVLCDAKDLLSNKKAKLSGIKIPIQNQFWIAIYCIALWAGLGFKTLLLAFMKYNCRSISFLVKRKIKIKCGKGFCQTE